jgi:hypothetical protein
MLILVLDSERAVHSVLQRNADCSAKYFLRQSVSPPRLCLQLFCICQGRRTLNDTRKAFITREDYVFLL